MKQTFKLIKQGQAHTQKLALNLSTQQTRHQAVAAALNVRPILNTSSGLNQTIFTASKRGFAAKLQEVPAMGDSISEGQVQEFVVAVGTVVKADDVIARIETDKVTVDIMAAFGGKVTKFHCEEGDTVPVGAPFVDIDADAAGSAPATPTPPTPEPVKAQEPVAAPVTPAPTPAAASGKTQLQEVPSMGDSISEGVVQEFTAQVGTAVQADEVIAKIETDKVTVDIMAAFSGVITKYHCAEGDTVPVGAPFVDITPGAAGAPIAAPAAAKQEAAPVSAPSTPAPVAVAPVTPTPSKPQSTPVPSNSANMTTVVAKKAPGAITGQRLETRVPLNRMRQTISRRLKESQNECASLTTFNEIDMSNIMDHRKQVQDAFVKKHGTKLGFMSCFMKASVQALKEQPIVNAVIDGKDTVHRDFIDISTAVSTPTGLVVPVIRNAQDMKFHEMELALADLAKRARENKITLEDMQGGTFSISNGGVFGSMFGTPIINMPQSAILGMHATKLRPTVVGSSIVARPIMYVALTYDHRNIDGREAVLFLRKIKECIEDPKIMLFDL